MSVHIYTCSERVSVRSTAQACGADGNRARSSAVDEQDKTFLTVQPNSYGKGIYADGNGH